MTEKEVLYVIKKEFGWNDTVRVDSFLHNPKADNLTSKNYTANLDMWPSGIARMLIRVEILFGIRFTGYECFETVGDVVQRIIQYTNKRME